MPNSDAALNAAMHWLRAATRHTEVAKHSINQEHRIAATARAVACMERAAAALDMRIVPAKEEARAA